MNEYYNLVFKYRPLRAAATLYALGAIVAALVLPAEHVHASLEGPAVVHRHPADRTPDTWASSSLVHGDHDDARVLQTVFECGRRFAIDSVVLAAALSLIELEWRVSGQVALVDESACHDPPYRLASLRAPPALLI